MSVVVSDTSPLHYLILCGAENILPRLLQQVVMPPAVFNELQQANTPPLVRQWAATLPDWAAVQMPKSLNLKLNVDAGELEAICLAQEIHAAAIQDVGYFMGPRIDLQWSILIAISKNLCDIPIKEFPDRSSQFVLINVTALVR